MDFGFEELHGRLPPEVPLVGHDKATNPALKEKDEQAISYFCEEINKDFDGPQTAIRLLAHKIQSPQEKEALYALETLEKCVECCGRRFHTEIGKFRFLNEIIKVVSPKYLGNKTTSNVKKKCIELLYEWHKGLPNETKIQDAYKMLKKQGVITEDPTYLDKKNFQVPPEKPKLASFEDEEKAKLLQKLLASKNPDDLQAANRLIKNMVKQEAEKSDRISRRINELETISNNVQLLQDMLSHYNPESTTTSEKEMMKEFYETLERLRPNLFRLASDVDDKDESGINSILAANDSVMKAMALYRKKVLGISEENGDSAQNKDFSNSNSTLLDRLFDNSRSTSLSDTPSSNYSMLDDQLLSLGLNENPSPKVQSNTPHSLSELEDIFVSGNPQHQAVAASGLPPQLPIIGGAAATGGLQNFTQPMSGLPSQPVYPCPAPTGMPSAGIDRGFTSVGGGTYLANSNFTGLSGAFSQNTSSPYAGVFNGTGTAGNMGNTVQKQESTQQKKAMEDLDLLGQTLIQENLPKDKTAIIPPVVQQQKIPLNQMQSQSQPAVIPSQTVEPPVAPGVVKMAADTSSFLPVSPDGSSPRDQTEILPLTDIFVLVETVEPGTVPPVMAFDKNGIKVILHIGKDRPRPDVLVMVVSVSSTNKTPIKNFAFQAAVPKVMKIKLQPASTTDLPAYNPILPPSAITQVMLIANPEKENIRLKFKVTYTMDEKSHSDMGEVDGFPVS